MASSIVLENLLQQPGQQLTVDRSVIERLRQGSDRTFKIVDSLIEAYNTEVNGVAFHPQPKRSQLWLVVSHAYCLKGTSLKGLLTAIAAAKEQAVYLEVLELIVDGKTNPEIAEMLYLSLSTVKTNIRSIMNKLAVDDRVQTAVVALRSGLV